jgi:hypothetical protein
MIVVAYAITKVLPKPAPQPEWARDWQQSWVSRIAGALILIGGMIVVSMDRRGTLPQFDPHTKSLFIAVVFIISGLYISSVSSLGKRLEWLEREITALRASSVDHDHLD